MRGTVTIDGKQVMMEANAATPVYYRRRFHSDFLIEMQKLAEGVKLTGEIKNLEPIENLAYLMAWQADPENTPGAIEEWLAGFAPMSIYIASQDIFRFWSISAGKVSELKKKQSAK